MAKTIQHKTVQDKTTAKTIQDKTIQDETTAKTIQDKTIQDETTCDNMPYHHTGCNVTQSK